MVWFHTWNRMEGMVSMVPCMESHGEHGWYGSIHGIAWRAWLVWFHAWNRMESMGGMVPYMESHGGHG